MNERYLKFFEYNFEMNSRFIKLFESVEIPGEFHLVEMSHLLKANKLWLERIEGKVITADFWSIISNTEMKKLNEELYHLTLDIIKKYNLSEQVNYSNSKGKKFNNSVEDIFFHLINHSNYHRARVAKYLRELDIIPPNSDYIFYIRETT